ncbi:MAG: class I SAM-dependent methyltransferase [Lautropia sp.]
MNPSDEGCFKRRMRAAWDRSAEGWNRHSTILRAWLGPTTGSMLDAAGVAPGMRVLDVAAGAGDQSLDAVARVGPAGRVVATDLSPAIVALAGENFRRAGLANVEAKVADAEGPGFDAGPFDAAICRLGLMFCADPAKALRNVHASLVSGRRFAAVVFAEPDGNPCVRISVATAAACAGVPAPDPRAPGGLFSLCDAASLEAVFRDQGFDGVATQRITAPLRLAGADAYVNFLRTSASPIQQLLAPLDPDAQARAWREIALRLSIFDGRQGWVGPNELLLCSGSAAAESARDGRRR